MLEYTTLKDKPTIQFDKEFDGEKNVVAYDLLAQNYQNISVENTIGRTLVVTEDYVARPDLISLAIYGDDMYADLICKLNGISNPFELNVGMYLILPQPNTMFEIAKNRPTNASEIIDEDSELFHKSVSYQKKSTDRRSPNQQVTGESNYVINKQLGVVFY